MNAVTSLIFLALRWVIFLIRCGLFAVYGVLQFLSKPGSRLICPALAAAGAYLCRLPLDALIQSHVLDVDWQAMPEPVTLEAAGASCFALAICVYVVIAPRVSQEGSVASGLIRLSLGLIVLSGMVGGMAYAGGHRLPDIMATYAPWMEWQPTLADTVLILVLIAAAFVYGVASRLLALLLGAFPPIVRPLAPLPRLRARNRAIRPVAVRVAVLRLPKRRKPRPQMPLPPSPLRLEHDPSGGSDAAFRASAMPGE